MLNWKTMKKLLPTTLLITLFLTLKTPCQAALPTWDPTGDDIVCNPRQGVRRLYGLAPLRANGQEISCSGEIFVLWAQIEPQEGEYDWTALDEKLDEAVRQNKKTSFSLGASGNSLPGYPREMPQWAYDAMQSEADVCCNGVTWLGSRYTPVPWNTIFQEKLTNILAAARDHIRANPDYDHLVSAVIMYCGGPWGEMNLSGYGSWEEWANAGYTHELFASAVLDLTDIYMDLFPDKPCALQLGNGLFYKDPTNPAQNRRPADIVKSKALQRYGTWVILKINGFGDRGAVTPDMGRCRNHLCSAETVHSYDSKFCWYEDGNEVCGPENEDQYFDHFMGPALTGYLQWYGPNVEKEFAGNPESFTYFARHAGAQIMNLETIFPATTTAGTAVNFNFKWFNRGNFPLFKTELQPVVIGGVTYQKGFPASYKIFVDLIDEQGQTAYHTTLTPNPPTTSWVLPDTWCLRHPAASECNPYTPPGRFGDIRYIVTHNIPLPITFLAGTYKVRIGLSDPDDDTRRWNLVNTPGGDGTGRYEVGTITVAGGMQLRPGWNRLGWLSSYTPARLSALVTGDQGAITYQAHGFWQPWARGFGGRNKLTSGGETYYLKRE